MLRSISLKTFAATEKLLELKTVDLLTTAAEAPPERGFDYPALKNVGKISAALDLVRVSGAHALKLDESSWNYLKDRIQAMRWAFYHPAFVEVTDDVVNAATIDPNAPTETAA